MKSSLRAAAIAALGFGVACLDGTGPPADHPAAGGRLDAEMHMLRQATVYPTEPARSGIQADATGSPKALAAYDATFWAVAGQRRTLSLNYADGSPFLTVNVGAGTLLQYPDGRLFQDGDSVQIRLGADQTLILIDLEPAGLVFNAQDPLLLHVAYSGADPDFNGDGVVDEADSEIETTSLGLWVQHTPLDPWYPNDATHDLATKSFTGFLYHFSNYTLSW